MDSKSILQQLDAQAPRVPVRNDISIAKYYGTAADLKTQADTYLNEQDDERAYIYYKRFVNLVLFSIAKHNAVNLKQYQKEKYEYRKQCDESISHLEQITVRLREKYDRLFTEQKAEEQQAAALAANLAIAAEVTPSAPPHEPAGDVAQEPTPAPLARPVSWDNLRLPKPREAKLPPSKPATTTTGGASPALAAATYPSLGKEASPAPATKLSSKNNGLIASMVAQRNIQLPATLLNQFLEYVKENTKRDVETCGILTGVLKKNVFHITTIVIPQQEATSNTCVTHSEEELFELQDKKGLLTLGWIHTHPSQSCFLSSIDLHTQFSYQVMLPEAIAIVLAPTAIPESGVFSLSATGMQVLSTCDARGFHRHTEDEGLYGIAQHAQLNYDKGAKVKIIDLRKPESKTPKATSPHAH